LAELKELGSKPASFILSLWRQSTFDLEFLCSVHHICRRAIDYFRTIGAIARRSVVIMKSFFRDSDRRAELSALVTIAVVLAIIAVAKIDAAAALFHIAR
jgi:hypothetical protein